jgi:hypothetical protein
MEALDGVCEMGSVEHGVAPGDGSLGDMCGVREDISKGDKRVEMVLCDCIEVTRDCGELGEGGRVETGKDGGEEFVGKGRHAGGRRQLTISHSFLSSGEITGGRRISGVRLGNK